MDGETKPEWDTQEKESEDSSVASLTHDSVFDESELEPKLSLSDHEAFQEPWQRKLRRRSRTFGSPLDFALEPVTPTQVHGRQHHIVQVLGIDGVQGDYFQNHHKWNPIDPSIWMDMNQAAKTDDETEEDDDEEEEEEEDIMVEKVCEKESANKYNPLRGESRMDYVLQPESVMSMLANEYLVGIRAHFSYWTNKDLLWHIICRLEQLPTSPADVDPSV